MFVLRKKEHDAHTHTLTQIDSGTDTARADAQLDDDVFELIDTTRSGVLMMRQNIVYASFYMSANEPPSFSLSLFLFLPSLSLCMHVCSSDLTVSLAHWPCAASLQL